MKRKYRVLDLFSGLGGATSAMIDDPNWTVVRIENNPLLEGTPCTQFRNVLEWLDWIDLLGEFDLVWASPPCTDFSNGYDAPKPTARRAGEDYEPDLSLMQAARDIIAHLKPEWWVIENVVGAREFFDPIMGRPTQILQAFHLWGRFPFIVTPHGWTHSKFEGDTWSTDELRPQKRALVPLEISKGLKDAIETQLTLEAWWA